MHLRILRGLWKADFRLPTLAKALHIVCCFVMVANHVVQSESILLQLICTR
jgi:hypothetical protein